MLSELVAATAPSLLELDGVGLDNARSSLLPETIQIGSTPKAPAGRICAASPDCY